MKINNSFIEPYHFHYPNQQEFTDLYREIFERNTYYIELESDQPRIIDAGAHIGLSTLYFKKLYTHSHITSVEPNPNLFKLLEENIATNLVGNVTTVNAGLSTSTGEQDFYTDPDTDNPWYSTGSLLPQGWTGEETTTVIKVPTITLTSLLNQPVDLLKLDIEGTEASVLKATARQLHQAKHLIVEVHNTKEQLEQVLQLLDQVGFETEVRDTRNKRLPIIIGTRK